MEEVGAFRPKGLLLVVFEHLGLSWQPEGTIDTSPEGHLETGTEPAWDVLGQGYHGSSGSNQSGPGVPGNNLHHPTLMEDPPLPRLFSHPLLTRKG